MADKANAQLSPQERIDAAVQEMVGLSVDEIERAHGDTILSQVVPDFLAQDVHGDYSELLSKIKRLEDLQKAADELRDAFRRAMTECPSDVTKVDHNARIYRGEGASHHNQIVLGGVSTHAYQAASLLADGLGPILRDLEDERRAFGGVSTRGAKKNLKAYRAAEMLARLYFKVKGELPTTGTSVRGEPSTKYTRALEEVFQAIGLGLPQTRGPAKAAIERLKAEAQLAEGEQ